MSWLFGSLQPDDDPLDDDDDDDDDEAKQSPRTPSSSRVQNDLSFLGQTLGRQLRGVATFLAPPPTPPSSNDAASRSNSQPQPQSQPQSQALTGIRNDLVEIGGSFKTGLSLLSTNSNKAVTEISKFASNLLQLQNQTLEDDDDDEIDEGSVPGISDEVLGFVTKISALPDLWTDFPLSLDHDFSMSNAQREHASTVEQLVPGITDLRVRVCSSMSGEKFWMIYFLLLLPRLDEHDFKLLSTPQIVEARDVLLQKLQAKRNTQGDTIEQPILDSPKEGLQVGKTKGEGISSQEQEASTEVVNTAERLKIDDEESTAQWSEEASISSGTSVDGQKKLEPEEEISFSDLEDNDNDLSSKQSDELRQGRDGRAGSPNGSNDWVQLNTRSETEGGQKNGGQSKEKDSEGEESSGWLTVDEFD